MAMPAPWLTCESACVRDIASFGHVSCPTPLQVHTYRPFVICLPCSFCALQALHTLASHHRLFDQTAATPYPDKCQADALYIHSWRRVRFLSSLEAAHSCPFQGPAVDRGVSMHRRLHIKTALQEH